MSGYEEDSLYNDFIENNYEGLLEKTEYNTGIGKDIDKDTQDYYTFAIAYKKAVDYRVYVNNGENEKGRGFFSIPGVNGLSESHLGLLRDKKVIICFDQDRAGQKSAYGYSVIEYNGQRVDFINKIEEFKKIEKINFLNNSGVEYKEVVYQGISSKLEKAGIEYSIKEWDTKLGSDINDVRIYGNINKLFN